MIAVLLLYQQKYLLSLKAPSKICNRQHSNCFSEAISFDISYEISSWQTIQKKCEDLFSLKNKNIKIFKMSAVAVEMGVFRVNTL